MAQKKTTTDPPELSAEVYDAIKLAHRHNELHALVGLLDDKNLDLRFPTIVADIIAFRNFAKREQLFLKAQIDLIEIDSHLRVIHQSGNSKDPRIPKLLQARVQLQQEIERWAGYEFWGWFKAIKEIWKHSQIRERLQNRELERRTEQLLKEAPQHKRQSKRATRDQHIFEIIQSGVKGLDYCRMMDERGIKGLPVWEDFPGYVKGYKSKWKRQIIGEKTRIAGRMKSRFPQVSQVSAETKSSLSSDPHKH